MSDIQVMFVPSAEIGYGRMGTYVDRHFRALGLDVSNDIDDPPAGTVLHCSTPAHMRKYYAGQRLVLNSMWESVNLPEAFRESLHLFDTVIVPSVQNVDLFGQYHDNVHFVPLGIDPDLWQPTVRTPPGQRFEFMIGGSGPRKGVDVAYKAFRAAFPNGSWGDGPEPWLILKSPKHSVFGGERVVQINGRLSAEDEIALYARIHCYLQPSRGEGFGLQPLQAIAQACPTILTDAHGHASFAHLGQPISAALTPTLPGSFMYGEAGEWWEPDLDELVDRMRWTYDHYDEACDHAWGSAQLAVEDFTWENTARKMLDVIGDLPPYAGSGEVMIPEVKLYRIVLNHHHAADVAGASYRWEPFTEYWVTSDLKRILFDGGHLDASCVFGDQGLTPAEIEQAGLLTGKESVCGTCHQRLGSQPTRADVLFEEFERQAREDGRV